MRELSMDSAPGADITKLKRDLRARGFGPKAWDDLPPKDERWGHYTAAQEDAVRAVQRHANKHGHRLAVDGIYGDQTAAYLATLPIKNIPALEPKPAGSGQPAAGSGEKKKPAPGAATLAIELRLRVLGIAAKLVGVREQGKNAGPDVVRLLKHAGGSPGMPWCMALCDYVYERACAEVGAQPALSPGLSCSNLHARASKLGRVKDARHAEPGDLLLLRGGPTGWKHVGIVERVELGGTLLHTIEGNTNKAGSAEGDGVYRKERRPSVGVVVDLCRGVKPVKS